MARKPPVNLDGAPPKYRLEMCDQARKLCLLGMVDTELADFFGVVPSTIDNWKRNYPDFAQALRDGKHVADAEIAASLYHRAKGYSHPAVKILPIAGEAVQVPYTEHYPPDTTAASLWLRNRQPGKWRDKVTTEHTGPDGGPLVPPSLTLNFVMPDRDRADG